MLPPDPLSFRSLVGLGLVMALVVAAATMPWFSRVSRPRLFAVAGALLAFQVFHFAEHLIQLAYWLVHPSAPPYMTPWAREGSSGLSLWASLVPGNAATMARGMELLHLVGNSLFLAGILALGHLARRELPGLRAATVLQSLHVAEHVLLTASVFALGRPLGVSTLFGLAEGASWGGSTRVWFHFLINLAATVPAVLAWRAYRMPATLPAAPVMPSLTLVGASLSQAAPADRSCRSLVGTLSGG